MSKTASLIPPPRLVRCNSISESRERFGFFFKLRRYGAWTRCRRRSAGSGAAVAMTVGAEGAGVPLVNSGAGEDAVATAGGGNGCRAIHISQAISPRTQRVMAIHAVRSINNAPAYSQTQLRASESGAGTGSIRRHPMDDIAAGASLRESSRARRRALRPLARNIRSRWAKNGTPNSLRRGTKAPVKSLSDSRE